MGTNQSNKGARQQASKEEKVGIRARKGEREKKEDQAKQQGCKTASKQRGKVGDKGEREQSLGVSMLFLQHTRKERCRPSKWRELLTDSKNNWLPHSSVGIR